MNDEKEPKVTPCLLYDAEPKKPYRVVLNYKKQLRPFFWFKVSRRGDVYLGPRYERITILQRSSQEITGQYSDIRYDEAETVYDPYALKRGPRISFHATGEIKFANDRAFRDSLVSLKEQSLLCLGFFEHPSKWSSITRARKYDVCLNYSIDETRPLWAQIYIAPFGKQIPVLPPSAVQQVNLWFGFRGLARVPDLLLQLVIGHGASGPWPAKSAIIFRHKPDSDKQKRERFSEL